MKNRKGFVLYVVIAILLGLAILAFALNEFKRGAVTQLAKNVDQNRLVQFCKSANAEYLAFLRSQVNYEPSSGPYSQFRDFFKEPPNAYPNFQPETISLKDYDPTITKDMARDSGYEDIEIKCWANVSVFRESYKKGNLAYDGYLDIFSKAYSKSHPESVIEIYERHDVRLVDVRHSFDKYVFFLKYFSPDLNNFNYRIIVEGIDTDSGSGFDPYSSCRISRVYLGTENYSPEQDKDKKENNRIWLDLCFDEIKDMPGFKNLFGSTNLTKFPTYNGANNLFFTKKMKFDNCFGIAEKEFYQVGAVKKIYEEFINNAAAACLGQEPGNDLKVGETLKSYCNSAISAAKSHVPPTTDTAAYRACKDYYEHFKRSSYDGHTVNDYSECEIFKGFLHTCFDNWYYEYGYLDANSVWKLTDFSRSKLSDAQDWTKNTPSQGGEPFSGLTECNYNGDHKESGHKCFQSYFNDYKDYNSQRCVVGKMIKLYGRNNKTPVLVEGPVNLRFFKLAYFPSFTIKLPMYSQKKDFVPEYVPILFRRKNRDKTFQSLDCNKDFSSNPSYFHDKDLMSKAIDSVPVNALILKSDGNGPKYYDDNGQPTTLNLSQVLADKFILPAKATSKANVIDFRRLTHEHSEVSYTYPSPKEFREDRIRDVKGKPSICIDGMMVIKQGDLDLTDIECFYGTGLVLLGKGNIKLGNLKKHDGRESDTLRLYLSDGSFIIDSSDSDVRIEASLAALYNSKSDNENKLGRLLLNGKRNVEIYGNLLVDFIKTLDTGLGGLAPGGTLLIKHDPYIVEPSISPGAQYQISIGKVKTAFSINAGGTVE